MPLNPSCIAAFFNDAIVGEHAIRKPDCEDGVPLQALRLVRGGKRHGLGLARGRVGALVGVDAGDEREIAEELVDVRELDRVVAQLFEVLLALVGVLELCTHVVLVNALDDAADHGGGRHGRAFGVDEFAKRVAGLLPGFRGLLRHLELLQGGESRHRHRSRLLKRHVRRLHRHV